MADQAGQKKQKKKQVKMSLNDFLADPSTGSWADEMDNIPSAPVAAFANDDKDAGYADRSRGYGGRGAGGFERRDRERDEPRFARAPVELPTRPPYTAHIGNLPFDVAEADIEEFFIGSPIANIRIMKDFEDRPKGFGYVEFESLDGLKAALEKNSQNLRGRNIRVSVAEPPREREVREDKTAGEWRRSEPLPPSSPSPNRFGGDRFGGPRGERGDREWGNRYGGERGERPERERAPEKTDVDNWRRTEPVVPVTPERPAWGNRGGDHHHREPREPREHRDTSWGPPSRPTQAPPTQRKKLDLKPRSADATNASTSSPEGSQKASSASSSSRASPFGAAKPVDSEEALRRAEERLSREKEAAEKARKERGPRAPRDSKDKEAKETEAPAAAATAAAAEASA